MTATFKPLTFSPTSLECASTLRASMVATSAMAGWTSCLLDHMEGDDIADPHEPQTTPDFKIAITLCGKAEVEYLVGSRWRSTINLPGIVNLTPGGETGRLRWRNCTPSPFRTAFLYIPSDLLLQAAELVCRPGQRLSGDLARVLAVDEQVTASVVASLIQGMEAGAPDIFAETGLRWLALHLVSRFGERSPDDIGARDGIALTDSRLARAVEFMTENLARPITIGEIASEAGVSPFHFSRLFARRLGLPPHAYLIRCRMEKAQRLLTTTGLPVALVAAECGYQGGSSFSSAFSRCFGFAPGTVRRGAR